MPTSSVHKTPIDRQWTGLARQLSRTVGETAAPAKAEINRLVAPLRPRPGFTPMPRKKYLAEYVLKRWQQLPSVGQLTAFAAYKDSKLRLGELRACPTKLRYKDWADDDWEHSISVLETLVICKPPVFAFQQRDLAVLSIHAIARRYERCQSTHRTEEAVLKDMEQVGHHVFDQESAEFSIPLESGGSWVGERVKVHGKVTMLIRTFIDR